MTHLFAVLFDLGPFEAGRPFGLVSDSLVDAVQATVGGARLPQHLAARRRTTVTGVLRRRRQCSTGAQVRHPS